MNITKHLLTGDELEKDDILSVLALAHTMKTVPNSYHNFLDKKHIALLFEKPSLRTRFSFTAAVNQLGGNVIESVSQTRKQEEPKDSIRVIQGYCSAMMIRTFDDETLTEMKAHATIPIINGLTDNFHPCQALADLLTLHEHFKTFNDLTITYIGDGNNVLHSLMMMTSRLGIHMNYCCPRGHEPSAAIIDSLPNKDLINSVETPEEAVKNTYAVYTDVWTSMGFEQKDDTAFNGFQVNEDLLKHARDDAVVMHCMPMERGREISDSLPDSERSVIFQQSENRMHVQKAILVHLLS